MVFFVCYRVRVRLLYSSVVFLSVHTFFFSPSALQIQTHVERLTQETVSLRSASSSFKSEAEHLLKEQATLQHTLKEKDTQIISIRETISQQEKSLNDSVSPASRTLRMGRRDGPAYKAEETVEPLFPYPKLF